MGLLGSAAAPVLAALLAWAGVATLTRRHATMVALAGLHVPLPALMAVIVPLVEVGIAGVLLVHPADGAAASLLLVAASHLALTWWAGSGLDCPRVGSSRLDPASWVDVGRNLGLGLLGVAALFGGSRMSAPGLPALVVVTTTVLIGMVLLALVELRGRSQWAHEGAAR